MSKLTYDSPAPSSEPLSALDRIFRFSGPVEDFWPILLEVSAQLFEWNSGAILLRDRVASLPWTRTSVWPSQGESPLLDHEVESADLAIKAVASGYVTARCGETGTLIALRLGHEEPGRDYVGIFFANHALKALTDEQHTILRLLTDAVRSQLRRAGPRVAPEHAQIAAALDLSLLLNEQKQALPAAMLFCNEIASRLGATRVSLGWVRGGAIRLLATSHTNKFEKNMGIVLELEGAMQECYDQSEEVLWPPREGDHPVARDHEGYARKRALAQVLSIPIRLDHDIKAVLTLERNDPRFKLVEIAGLRLICDIAARRMDDLQRHGRGFLPETKTRIEEKLAKWLGAEHTWIKVAAIGGSLTLAFLLFWPWPYRIEGQMRLRARTQVLLPAPFEGYIHQVFVRPGDQVKKDQPLLDLDPTELKLQESEALAGQMRYMSESQLAQGNDKINDMRIADAQYQQAIDRLKEVRYNLTRSELRSPFDGVLVEGDITERIGSPVKKGEILVKVCQLDGLYVTVDIPERDIHRIKLHSKAKVALSSRPEIKTPIVVTLIEPSAQARKEGNMFAVRCEIEGPQPDWWRPGMTGIAKISAGRASPLWLITHRLLDFLRLKLWI